MGGMTRYRRLPSRSTLRHDVQMTGLRTQAPDAFFFCDIRSLLSLALSLAVGVSAISCSPAPTDVLPAEVNALMTEVGATFTVEPELGAAYADSSRGNAITVALRGTRDPAQGGLTAVHGSLRLSGVPHSVWLVTAASVTLDGGTITTTYSFVEEPADREILGWNAIGATYLRRRP